MILLALGSWLVSSTRHNFPLIKQGLIPARELLVTVKICIPLLYPQGYSSAEFFSGNTETMGAVVSFSVFSLSVWVT